MTRLEKNQTLNGSAVADVSIQRRNLDVALALVRAGMFVFPARVHRKSTSEKWEKAPLVRDWQSVATTNPDEICALWRQNPGAVPGIELGRSGLLVVDADRHGGPDGVAALDELTAANGGFPEHPVTETPGNGEHHIFRQPAGQKLGNRTGSLPPGIDVRGVGGWIVAPGAVRPDGRSWQTAAGTPSLTDVFKSKNVPPPPDWLVNLVRAPRAARARDANAGPANTAAANNEGKSRRGVRYARGSPYWPRRRARKNAAR